MAINYRSLKENIAFVVKSLTTKAIIWSNQNANTPTGDYIALKISSTRFIGGNDWESHPNANEVAQTQGDRELVLSVIVVSENSMEILLDLIDKLNLNSNLELLSTKKLAYVGLDGDIADITTEINGSFETRAVAELIFRISKNYSSATEDNVAIIGSVEVGGTLDGGDIINSITIPLTVQ